MRKSSIVLIAAVLAVLAACGGGDDEPTAAPDATRTVETAYGEVEIPAEPQRIVGDLMTVDYLSALGYDTSRIVGVFDRDFFPTDHYLAGVLEVRYGGTASFQDWRSTVRAYGALLDRGEEAEAYVAGTEAQIDDLRTSYGDLIAGLSATEAKSTPDYMAVNALSSARTSGVLGSILLSELGFHAPDRQQALTPDEYGTIELSAENLDLVDGDLLFLEVREDARGHEDSPLWPTLGVVRNGGVVVVGNHWEYGGATAARVVLADIEAALDDLAIGTS